MVNRLLGVFLLLGFCGTFQSPAQTSEADRKLFRDTQARADKGDAEAQLAVGNLYFSGTGVSKNLGKGAKWHRKAAEQGLPAAQYQLALDYMLGEGLKEDKTEAAAWLRRAADKGLASAQVELGLCYLRGDGVRESGADAIEWFRKAAALGAVDAEYQIGKCYVEGAGVPRDIEDGVKWIRHAAERGYPPAQNTLGLYYEKGTGVAKDPLEAYKWFALAASRDDAAAADIKVSMAKVETSLTPEQIAEAQRLARQFKPKNSPLPDTAEAAQKPGSNGGVSSSAEGSQTGVVNVTTEDAQSEVFADGKFFGNAPAKLKLKEGSHVIEVKRTGFKPYRREMNVTAGSDLNLRVVLERE